MSASVTALVTDGSNTLDWRVRGHGERVCRPKQCDPPDEMLLRLGTFIAAGAATYLTLSVVLRLVCVALGHNATEMLFAEAAIYLLSLAAAVEGALFPPEKVRGAVSSTRLTQRFRSSCDWRLR